jgi:hypothetical protein
MGEFAKASKRHWIGPRTSVSRGSTRSIERANHLCANPSCILCGGLQLGLKVLDLNAEGLLKIPGVQKLLAEVSVSCNLPLEICLEGAYLLLIGAWKASHGFLDHINVALRSASASRKAAFAAISRAWRFLAWGWYHLDVFEQGLSFVE